MEASGDVLKPDEEEPNHEDESKAKLSFAKSTRTMKTSKLNAGNKTATKSPSPPQHDNETIGNSRYPDRPRKLLGKWWKNHIPQPKDNEHANMKIVGELKNLRKTFESSNASEWKLAMQEKYEYLIANATWKLVPLRKGHKAAKCKWVFHTKNDVNGVVV